MHDYNSDYDIDKDNDVKQVQEKKIRYMLKEGAKMVNFKCECLQLTDKSKTVNTSIFNFSDIKKPILINFWATWCGPCVREIPDLQNLYLKYKKDFEFIFINCGTSVNELKEFINKNKYSIPIGIDEDNKISDMFSIFSIPYTIFVDGNKNIKHIIIGARTEQEYEKLIKEMLQK